MVTAKEFIAPDMWKLVLSLTLFLPILSLVVAIAIYFEIEINLAGPLFFSVALSYVVGCGLNHLLKNKNFKIGVAIMLALTSLLIIHFLWVTMERLERAFAH